MDIDFLMMEKRKAYLEGVISGIEQLRSDLVKYAFEDNEDARSYVASGADMISCLFEFELYHIQEEIDKKLGRVKDNG